MIRIRKSGYVPYEQRIFFTKGFCAERQQVSLSFNLVKNSPRNENTGFIVLNGHEEFSGRLVITDQSNEAVSVKDTALGGYAVIDLEYFKGF